MTVQEARLLIRYTAWASRKVLAAAEALPAEVRDRANGISHESIAGTLAHIYWADRAWLQRLHAPAEPLPPRGNYAECAVEWPKTLDGWVQWAEELRDDAELSRAIEYKSAILGPSATPVYQIVFHVVNHATLHRGQVMGMLRQLGIAPPATDLIYYYREPGVAASAS